MNLPRRSSRLPRSLEPNRLARLLAGKRRAGVPILDLTESNPTRAGIEYPPDFLHSLADRRNLVYEPDPRGLPEARRAVHDYYAARGARVDPARIVLTASTSEAYSFLFKLLADPGDTVLVPAPSYPLFEHLAALESVRTIAYPLVYDRAWAIDFEALRRRALGETPRALILVHPNNPTGSFLHRRELPELVAFCREAGAWLIVDEVFSDYPLDAPPEIIPSLLSELPDDLAYFVLSGLSKVCGLPQLKLGWIVANAPAEIQDGLDLIGDTYLSVGTPVQRAAGTLLAARGDIQARIRDRLRGNLDALRLAVRATPSCEALPCEGGWYAVLRVPRVRPEEELCGALLEEDDVLVHPGYFFDFPEEAYLVLSLLTRPEILAAGLARILSTVTG